MRISTVKTPKYDPALLRQAVRRHLDILGAEEFLRPGVRVLLKPNLLMKRAPAGGTTTHPALVEAVALELGERGIDEIVIADSPGGPYTRSALEGVYRTCGMTGAAQRSGARLNLETGYERRDSAMPQGLCGSFNLIRPVLEADVIINLPKLKTHAMTTLSGGVKNLLGCVPGLQKPELHFRFPEKDRFGRMLVELCELVRPQLTIVDAVVSMEGDGPSAGRLRETGWTLASRQVHALDVALCRITGLDPREVPTLAFAREAGLAPRPEELVWLGDGMPDLGSPFLAPQSKTVDFSRFVPGPLQGVVAFVARKILSPRPAVRARDCVGCGKCAESCPADTIGMTGGKARIHYQNCIKCYCCHEMCPVRAIHIKSVGLLRH